MSKNQDPSTRSASEEIIRTKIHEISERTYAASWMHNIEFTVWDALDAPSSLLDDTERDQLKEASEAIDGWMTWDERLGKAVFVPMSEWRRMCQESDMDDEYEDDFYDQRGRHGID
jgi:hypothetical protein